MGLTQHGQADQQQEPHASAGVEPSAQAGESSLSGGPPPLWRPTRILPGRCLQRRDNLEATTPQGLSNQGWAQSSRLSHTPQGIKGYLGLGAKASASTAELGLLACWVGRRCPCPIPWDTYVTWQRGSDCSSAEFEVEGSS